VKNAAVMPLSRNDCVTAVDVGGAGDTDTSVDNDETVRRHPVLATGVRRWRGGVGNKSKSTGAGKITFGTYAPFVAAYNATQNDTILTLQDGRATDTIK